MLIDLCMTSNLKSKGEQHQIRKIWCNYAYYRYYYPPNSLLLYRSSQFFLKMCPPPFCHCWCPPFSAAHAAFLFICLPGSVPARHFLSPFPFLLVIVSALSPFCLPSCRVVPTSALQSFASQPWTIANSSCSVPILKNTNCLGSSGVIPLSCS